MPIEYENELHKSKITSKEVIFAKFLGENGLLTDMLKARQQGLIFGMTYLLSSANVNSFYTDIELVGIPEKFNSAMFTFYNENGEEVDLMKTSYNNYGQKYN